MIDTTVLSRRQTPSDVCTDVDYLACTLLFIKILVNVLKKKISVGNLNNLANIGASYSKSILTSVLWKHRKLSEKSKSKKINKNENE